MALCKPRKQTADWIAYSVPPPPVQKPKPPHRPITLRTRPSSPPSPRATRTSSPTQRTDSPHPQTPRAVALAKEEMTALWKASSRPHTHPDQNARVHNLDGMTRRPTLHDIRFATMSYPATFLRLPCISTASPLR